MRRFGVRAVGAMLLACLVLAPTATAGDLPREVAAQYGAALDKMKRLYSEVTVTGRLSFEYPGQGMMRKQNFTYRADGAKVRIDVTLTGKRGRIGGKVGSTDMYMTTPDGSLHTFEGPGSPVFDNADEETSRQVKGKIEGMCLMTYPYSFEPQGTILDMLLKSNCKVLKVEKVKVEGRYYCKIHFQETTVKEGHASVKSSWLLLSPSEGWALHEYSRMVRGGQNEVVLHGVLTYSGTKDGVPLLSRIEHRREEGPQHTVTLKQSIEIDEFTTDAPDDYYFTAFAF